VRRLSEINPDAVVIDGFEDALVGFGGQHRLPTVAVYDGLKLVSLLVESRMDIQVAQEYIGTNVSSAYCGPNTPIIFWRE